MKMKTIFGIALALNISGLLLTACGEKSFIGTSEQPSSSVQPNSPQQPIPPQLQPSVLGYLDNTRTLHLINSHGQPLPGIHSIPNVETFKISSQWIAYQLRNKELHLLDTQGNEFENFLPLAVFNDFQITDQFVAYRNRPGMGISSGLLHVLNTRGEFVLETNTRVNTFQLSNQWIAYQLSNSQELHLFDLQEQRIPQWFQPESVEDFQVTNQFVAYTTFLNDHLFVFNIRGEPMLRIINTQGVSTFHLSDQLIAYQFGLNPTLHISTTQGQPLSNFQSVAVSADFKVTDQFVAYQTRSDSVLHVLNAQGEIILETTEEVSTFEISDQWIAYQATNDNSLHILNTQGQQLPGLVPFVLDIINGDNFGMSNQFVGYTLNGQTSVFNAQGQPIVNISTPITDLASF